MEYVHNALRKDMRKIDEIPPVDAHETSCEYNSQQLSISIKGALVYTLPDLY